MGITESIALALGASWASGINLYAAILTLGIMGLTGSATLPPDLEILANPLVIAAAGLMYMVEFVTDKVPGLDTVWDSIHTFVRIPAGVILAAGATAEFGPGVELAAAIVGGTLAASTHATKAGTRAVVNTSPEPFSNWTLSIGEDLAVIGGVWASLKHPWVFIVLLVVFVALMVWLLPKIWRGVRRVFGWLARALGAKGPEETPAEGSAAEPPPEAAQGPPPGGVHMDAGSRPPPEAANTDRREGVGESRGKRE